MLCLFDATNFLLPFLFCFVNLTDLNNSNQLIITLLFYSQLFYTKKILLILPNFIHSWAVCVIYRDLKLLFRRNKSWKFDAWPRRPKESCLFSVQLTTGRKRSLNEDIVRVTPKIFNCLSDTFLILFLLIDFMHVFDATKIAYTAESIYIQWYLFNSWCNAAPKTPG